MSTQTKAERDKLFEVNKVLAAALKPFAVYGKAGSKDVEVGAAIHALKLAGEIE